jgi:lipoyl(octanoyl) transferase
MQTIRYVGKQDYEPIWAKMKAFTTERLATTEDELWLLEHFPVYTQGQAGKAEHLLNTKGILVVQTDRGGQVTYHGPGQLVVYVLMDLRRQGLGVRTLVSTLEDVLITLLERYQITASRKCAAPGVYVAEKKIASIGLRVKNGCSYHGIALNVKMDLTPFAGINPCGFAAMQMTQISEFYPEIELERVKDDFIEIFHHQFTHLSQASVKEQTCKSHSIE